MPYSYVLNGWTWGHSPIHLRINQDTLQNPDKRLIVRQAFEAMCPKIGSGFTHDGTTYQTPATALEAHGLSTVTNVYVWAKNFEENPSAWAWTDVYHTGGTYEAAVIIFNKAVTLTMAQFSNAAYHEVGHVAGLDHCADQSQVMGSSPPPYRSGDLAGFAALKAAA